jgi:hypothetical protein
MNIPQGDRLTISSSTTMVTSCRIAGRRFGLCSKDPDYRRRRKCDRGTVSFMTKIAAFTIVATCIMCCVAGFSSSGVLPRRFSSTKAESTARTTTCLRPFALQKETRSPFFRLTSTTGLYSSNSQDSDKQEWQAIYSAFQMYKAAYGDLKVPMRFIVPAMPPWPGESA